MICFSSQAIGPSYLSSPAPNLAEREAPSLGSSRKPNRPEGSDKTPKPLHQAMHTVVSKIPLAAILPSSA